MLGDRNLITIPMLASASIVRRVLLDYLSGNDDWNLVGKIKHDGDSEYSYSEYEYKNKKFRIYICLNEDKDIFWEQYTADALKAINEACFYNLIPIKVQEEIFNSIFKENRV